jgi:hypothetical protein
LEAWQILQLISLWLLDKSPSYLKFLLYLLFSFYYLYFNLQLVVGLLMPIKDINI